MKKITRILALLLALVMLLGLAACGGTSSDSDEPTLNQNGGSNANVGANKRPTITVGVPGMPNVLDYQNNDYTIWIEEQTGVNLEIVVYAMNEWSAQIQTSIAGNEELPDILWGMEFPLLTRNMYGQDGYLIDLLPYFNDPDIFEKYPFWEEQLNTWIDDEQRDLMFEKGIDPSTGELYAFPYVSYPGTDEPQNMGYINTVWLDKLGLDMPTSIEELKVVLEAFKTQDPNGNGVQDEIPMIGSMCAIRGDAPTWLTNSYIFNNDYYIFNATDGKLWYPWITDEYRQGLRTLREFVQNGWLSTLTWTLASAAEIPATFTPSSGVASCGVFFGHIALRIQEDTPLMYEYQPLPPFNYAPVSEDAYIYRSYITDSCDDPELAFKVLMYMQSPEGQMAYRIGLEGRDWEWQMNEDLDGNPCMRPVIIAPNDVYAGQTTATWGGGAHGICQKPIEWTPTYPLTDEETWETVRSDKHYDHYEKYMAVAEANNPDEIVYSLIYTEEELDIYSECYAAIQKVIKTGRAEFATGVRNINSDSDWQAYIAEFNKAGADQMLEIAQEAYDRQKAK